VSPPVLPCSPLTPSAPVIPVEPVIPVDPVIPVAPVSPFSAGAPGAPCGPAGPGTGTVTTAAGAAGTTMISRSHAPNASTDSAAATTIEYFMIALSIFEQGLSAVLRAALQTSALPRAPSGAARRHSTNEERFTDSSYVGAVVKSVRYRSYREIERLAAPRERHVGGDLNASGLDDGNCSC
jgi:hypothetical protein